MNSNGNDNKNKETTEKRSENNETNSNVSEKDLYRDSLNEIVTHLNNNSEDDKQNESSVYMVKDDHRIPINKSQLTDSKELVPVDMGEDDSGDKTKGSETKKNKGENKKPKQKKISEISKMLPHRADFSGMGNENVPMLATEFNHEKEQIVNGDGEPGDNKKKRRERSVDRDDKPMDREEMSKLSRKERKEMKIKSRGMGLSSKEYIKSLKEDREMKLEMAGRKNVDIMEYPTKTKVDFPNKKPIRTSKIPNAGAVKIMSRNRRRNRKQRSEV